MIHGQQDIKCVYVYLQTARAGPLTPIGGVTPAETHQAADVEASVRMRTQWGADRMPVVSELLTCLTR
jgi:hypothetical protein